MNVVTIILLATHAMSEIAAIRISDTTARVTV